MDAEQPDQVRMLEEHSIIRQIPTHAATSQTVRELCHTVTLFLPRSAILNDSA